MTSNGQGPPSWPRQQAGTPRRKECLAFRDKLKRIDSLIFDLDGTLWDTTEACVRAWNRVREDLALPFPPVTIPAMQAVTGQSHESAVRGIFPHADDTQVGQIQRLTDLEENRIIAKEGGFLYDGVRETLPALAAHKPLLIVSNCTSGYIEGFLDWSGLGEHFVDVECWGNTKQSKGENVRRLVGRNGLCRPIIVGDTDGDWQAARANDLRFVFASYGFGQVAAPDATISRFAELPGVLETFV